MNVQLGNPQPTTPTPNGAPAVTYIYIPDTYSVTDVDIRDIALKLARNSDIPSLPGHEAFLTVVHNNGVWNSNSTGEPSWAWSDNEILEKQLQDYYGVGDRPDDVEETHYTMAGAPGVGASVAAIKSIKNIIVNQGRQTWARSLFGANGVFGQTISGSTSFSSPIVTGASTTSGNATTYYTASNVTVTSGAWQGFLIVAVNTTGATGSVYGNIVTNTAASNSQSTITVDQWYTPGSDGTTAAATPSTNSIYFISPTASPSWYIGLNGVYGGSINNSMSPTNGWLNLTSEITTTNGGLVRKAAAVGITSSQPSTSTSTGSTVVTLASTFTANGSDTLPVGINGIGLFNTRYPVASGSQFTGLMFASAFTGNNAIISAAGDTITVTEQITGA